ncbi:MAG TPA: sigma-70 family RNA polymerase sigma factor [Gemmataceae bacterium]|nr:sigma-70 family RNA polymerase sigma factor [Gemmataceae bacterium]
MPDPEPNAALDAWVRGTLTGAVAYARSLLRNRTVAEDVVHDCFCRLLRRADVYDLPNDGTKLLYRAITNACINHTQRARSVSSLDDGELSERLADGKSATPAEEAAASELEAAMNRGLARLSVMQRAAVELKSLGHSLEDIADTLGLSATNAGVLVHRARRALAAELAAFLPKVP